jgi:hypothetical protein
VKPPPCESDGPAAAVAALKKAAQSLMDAAINGDNAGVLAHLDRDCATDRKASVRDAAAIRRMAHGVHPRVKAVFVIGTMGGVVKWSVPSNAPEALKRYLEKAPAARTNDWTVDPHGQWVQETSCIPTEVGVAD